MKKILIVLFCIIQINLILVNASSPTLGTFEKGKEIELKQTCTINGTFCDVCNISSVDYPNGTRIIYDIVMTKRNGDFNYTLNSDYVNVLGTYKINGYCTYGSDVIRNWVYYFIVTPTGEIQTTSQAISGFIFLILMISLAIIFGILGFKLINNEYLWVLGLFFIVLSIFILVYDVWLGVIFKQNYIGISNNTTIIETLFWIILFVIVSGLIISGFLLFRYWDKVMRIIFPKKYLDGWDDNKFE